MRMVIRPYLKLCCCVALSTVLYNWGEMGVALQYSLYSTVIGIAA